MYSHVDFSSVVTTPPTMQDEWICSTISFVWLFDIYCSGFTPAFSISWLFAYHLFAIVTFNFSKND